MWVGRQQIKVFTLVSGALNASRIRFIGGMLRPVSLRRRFGVAKRNRWFCLRTIKTSQHTHAHARTSYRVAQERETHTHARGAPVDIVLRRHNPVVVLGSRCRGCSWNGIPQFTSFAPTRGLENESFQRGSWCWHSPVTTPYAISCPPTSGSFR